MTRSLFRSPVEGLTIVAGASAIFSWGGATRAVRPEKVELHHRDVVVWGGDARLRFHGVAPVKAGLRYDLTFRRAR
jgi:alkylated DNA repair protein (DNA oxidative demethylase)